MDPGRFAYAVAQTYIRGSFQVSSVHHETNAKGNDPFADHSALHVRKRGNSEDCLSVYGSLLDRHHRRVPEGDEIALRSGLQIFAGGRPTHGNALRRKVSGHDEGSR